VSQPLPVPRARATRHRRRTFRRSSPCTLRTAEATCARGSSARALNRSKRSGGSRRPIRDDQPACGEPVHQAEVLRSRTWQATVRCLHWRAIAFRVLQSCGSSTLKWSVVRFCICTTFLPRALRRVLLLARSRALASRAPEACLSRLRYPTRWLRGMPKPLSRPWRVVPDDLV
jgi:hypothetical protein